MSIVLKDWYGKDQRFDHDKIFVSDEYGKLVQFTQGTGEPEVNEVILNNLEVTGFAEDSTYGAYSKVLAFGTDIEDAEIVVGKEYTVGWDGELYTTVAKDTGYVIEEEDGYGGTLYHMLYYLGNGTLLNYEGLEGNEEPFAILYASATGLTIVTTDTAESHVLGLIKRVRPRETLDMMLESITVTENGTYTADPIYDGLKQVVVEVAGVGVSDDVRYVTFMSYDGSTEYGKKAVAVGDDCADPITRGVFDTPTRESDVKYNYTFNGWATESNGAAVSNWNKAITEDKTVYAYFMTSYVYYTVTFYDDDTTTVLNTKSVTYMSDASYTPEKAGYKFLGWSEDVTNVTSDMEVYATWQVDDGYIHDSWETVVARAQNGTASNYYSVGDKIALPLTYTDGTTEEIDLYLAAFDAGKMEDGNPCNIVFVCAEALKTLCAFSTITLSSSKLSSTLWNTNLTVFNHLLNVVFPALPSVLRDNIKARDMYHSKAPNLQLWLPEDNDLNVVYSTIATRIDLMGVFPDANSRIMYKTDGTGPVEWLMGNPYWSGSYYYAQGYGTDGEELGTSGYISENPASTPRGVVFGFCI